MPAEWENNSLAKRYMELDVAPAFDAYTGVEIVVDENNTIVSPENDAERNSGRVLRIENPWGTQAMADNILASLRGFTYKPYTASGALLNPAAEIGDAVTVGTGVYSGIYKLSKSFGSLMSSDVEAPQDEEIDHEYPFELKQNRQINRKFMSVESELRLQSGEISAKVSQTGGDNSSFGWSLVSDHFSLYSGSSEVFRVDENGAEVKGIITATSGKIGNFNIGSSAIWNNIPDFANSGGLTSGVYLGTDGIRLGQNFTVTPSGSVSANNMTITGTLMVGGSQITANALRSGAQSAYTNGGAWTTGAARAAGYYNATLASSGQYPDYFRAKQLACNIIGGTTATFDSVVARSNFYLGSTRPLNLIPISQASYVVGY